MTTLAQQVEALLFMAGEAVPISDLAKLVSARIEDTRKALEEISEYYKDNGITIIITDQNAQLVTSPSVAEFLTQFRGAEKNELTKAGIETLAVIAYKGPITRYDVDAIRGVDSRKMIRQLLIRGLLIQIRTAGQASMYDISEEALMHLGIATKNELPKYKEYITNDALHRLVNS